MRPAARRRSALLGVAGLLTACVPRLHPATGIEVRRALPGAQLEAGSRLIVLQWELQDPEIVARGDAAARVTSPDSARLDFFLAGGLGRGAVLLLGQRLVFPASADDFGRRLVPPPPLLWAALGRLALPPEPDTTIHQEGDTLRADIGRPVVWRVTFLRDTLWRVERVLRERVLEWVQRDGPAVRYRDEASRRQLDLRITRMEPVGAFDPWIWSFP